MKNIKLLVVSVFALGIISWFGVVDATAQTQSTALERGYRTGYSDGYNAGFNDITNRAPRDIQSKEDYQRAERSYNEVWGPIEDFRDGYQQGFETGYNAAYDRQTFNSSIPASLKRRTLAGAQTHKPSPAPAEDDNTAPATDNNSAPVVNSSTSQDIQAPASTATAVPASLPRNSVLLVELLSGLSTDVTQVGDRFQARVIEPNQLDGATVEGRVTAVRRPGKVKGVAELQLAFETLRLPGGRITPFSADVIEVVQTHGDGVATVDPEGGIRGKSSTKDDVAKVGAASGIGAIIGAIAGGGKGAAIGAVIGGGAGTGVVMNDRGKDIRLDQGQQLRIRTASDTQIAQN